jgi:hypothetical protein
MTKIIYDRYEKGVHVLHEITFDENEHPTWSIKENWKGLTDDEIRHCLYDLDTQDFLQFARAIEQALRSKNGY